MGYKRIVREIIKYLPKENITFKKTHDGSLEVNFVDRDDSSFIIRKEKGNDWDYVKKMIDNILSLEEDGQICYNECIKRFTCPRCLNSYCGGCYVNIISCNWGKHVCPYCTLTTRIIEPYKTREFCDRLAAYMQAEIDRRYAIGAKHASESDSEAIQTPTPTETEPEPEACAKISCACGGKYSKKWEKNHFNTKMHKKLLERQSD